MISDRGLVLLVLMLGIAAMSALAGVMIWREALARTMESRLAAVVSRWEPNVEGNQGHWYDLPVRAVRRIGQAIGRSRVFSQKDILELEQAISAAGYNPRELVPMLIGAKILAMVLVPASTYLLCMLRSVTETHMLMFVVISIPV